MALRLAEKVGFPAMHGAGTRYNGRASLFRVNVEWNFVSYRTRQPKHSASMDKTLLPTRQSDVAIIGAGFSGINIACQLQRKLGVTDYVIYDRAADFGGTWFANRCETRPQSPPVQPHCSTVDMLDTADTESYN